MVRPGSGSAQDVTDDNHVQGGVTSVQCVLCSFPEAVTGQSCDQNVALWPRLTNVGPPVLQRVSL